MGAYRLLRVLGAGGMGKVWLGEHQVLGRRAAVKVLHEHLTPQQEIVNRFFNEARAATAIADPGIVQIFDFGRDADGVVYIVMEWLDGAPLDRRLTGQLSSELHRTLRLVRQVATSLGAAHSRGIVHRDLKPENIFVVADAEVAGGERTKILDFGIAKLATNAGGVKTETSVLLGTPVYMSPEQCRGAGHVDQRSDIYSLGCVIFDLLTGRPPFVAEGTGEVIAMHLRESPPTPSALMSSIPPAVDTLILRCLEKDPSRRFSSGTELAAALEVLLRLPEPQDARPETRVTSQYISPPTTLSAASAEIEVPTRDRRARILMFVSLVMAASFLAVCAMRRGAPDRSSTQPATPTLTPAAVDSTGIDASVDAIDALQFVPLDAVPSDAPSRPSKRTASPSHSPTTQKTAKDGAPCVQINGFDHLPEERFSCPVTDH